MFNENMIYGIHIGEHGFDEDTVLDEIKERVLKPGYNFVTIRTRARSGEIVPHETYLKWAKLLADNKVYFLFLYTILNLTRKRKKEISQRIKLILDDHIKKDEEFQQFFVLFFSR